MTALSVIATFALIAHVPTHEERAWQTCCSARCAATCAYVVSRLSGNETIRIDEVFRELPGASEGEVTLQNLVDYLNGQGLHTRVIRGMDGDKLRAIDLNKGLFAMPLVITGEEPAALIDHVMLFLWTTDEGDFVFVNSRRLRTMSSEALRNAWQGGYALLAARQPSALDDFLSSIGYHGAIYGKCAAAFVTGGALSLLIWALFRCRLRRGVGR